MQISMIWRPILTLISRWSHIELIIPRTTKYKKDKKIKYVLEGGKRDGDAETIFFKRKRQENILSKNRSIKVILLLEYTTSFNFSLSAFREEQSPYLNKKAKKAFLWLAEGIIQKLLFLVRGG